MFLTIIFYLFIILLSLLHFGGGILAGFISYFLYYYYYYLFLLFWGYAYTFLEGFKINSEVCNFISQFRIAALSNSQVMKLN